MNAQHTFLALLALAATPGLMHPSGRSQSLTRSSLAKAERGTRTIQINEQDQYIYDDQFDLAAEDLDDQPYDADTYMPMPRQHLNESGNRTEGSEAEDYASARAMARLIIMDRLLTALGFGESLPTPPNDTLATMPTPINITSEHCPYKYKRCSSQAFFPSCDHPRNTDPETWAKHFNLYFNLSDDFDNTLDVINATLRLFKNKALPLEYPTTLLIKVSMYNRSLNRRRAKKTLIADVQVPSDYIGWVSLPVAEMVRKWKKSRNNHGLLVAVSDVIQMTWDAPKLFVTMDCSSGLNPLPFEIQTDLEGQRYPALNVRHGSIDEEFPGTTEPSTQDSWIMNINPDLLNEDSSLKLAKALDNSPGIHADNLLVSEDLKIEEISPRQRHHFTVNHVDSDTFEPKSTDSEESISSEDIKVRRKQKAETRHGRGRNRHSQRQRHDSRMT
ncbi:unnamed protein product [Meganyctiphanes norvegica]|uniref:TGF-beta propeptide domain-containing protein n=1 Tax=Meganyctiphanes norvegica TaxID=48144 RepID=A0AAV2RPN9_MEGNR